MGVKVFVGNLSFATTEADLAEAFAEAGTVEDAKIITRGPRSLGYGFVDLATEEEAQNAVRLMDKKELDGRPINVEVAHIKEDKEEANPDNAEKDASENPEPASRRGRDRGRGRRRGRGRGSRGRGGASRGGADAKARLERKKNPSETTLFVANLPFAFTDEELKELFSEYEIADAHVVKKPNGPSRGYGFVDFVSKEAQEAALQGVDKTEIDGREISVRVALTIPVEQERAAQEAEKEEGGEKVEENEKSENEKSES